MTVDRSLRFCMVTTFYPPYSFGGDAIFVRNLSRELVGRGHSVEVIHSIDAFRALSSADPEVEPTAADRAIKLHGLSSRSGFLSALAMHQTGWPALLGRQIRSVLAKDFDVIHFHNVSLIGGPAVLRLGDAVKLYSLHEWWLVCPTHSLFRFDRAACERPHCLTCTLMHRRPPQWWRLSGALENAVQEIDAFITPSQFAGEIHRQRGLDLPSVHIPNFVSPPEEDLDADGREPESGRPPYFLFVGRLEKLKGLQTLIPVFRGFDDAALWVAGAGGFEKSLRAAARGSNVQFLGWKTGRELQALYRGAVAVIVPSLCYETFCLVAAEALQQGTPVLVRDLGALPEIVKMSRGGLIYKDDTELLAGMKKLLEDRELRDRLGKNGHATSRELWTADAYLEKYLQLVRELTGSRPQPQQAAG